MKYTKMKRKHIIYDGMNEALLSPCMRKREYCLCWDGLMLLYTASADAFLIHTHTDTHAYSLPQSTYILFIRIHILFHFIFAFIIKSIFTWKIDFFFLLSSIRYLVLQNSLDHVVRIFSLKICQSRLRALHIFIFQNCRWWRRDLFQFKIGEKLFVHTKTRKKTSLKIHFKRFISYIT